MNELFYKRLLSFESTLKTVARSICKTNTTAIEDIVQDTFIEAIQNIKKPFPVLDDILPIVKRISYRYHYDEYKNPAKPIGYLYNVNKDQENDFLFNLIPDKHNHEDHIIAQEKLSHKRLYKGRWLDFESARNFVQQLGLKSYGEWRKYIKTKKPPNIPANPQEVYPEYISIKNWIGTEFLNYEDCKNWIKNNIACLGVDCGDKYYLIKDTLPCHIPKHPNQYYKDKGWINWPEFLGSSKSKYDSSHKINRVLLYEKAKEYVQLNLVPIGVTSSYKWDKYFKQHTLPYFLPSQPHRHFYNNGWKGANDFFGNENKKFYKKNYWSYKKAKEWVRLNLRIEGIDCCKQWEKYVRGDFKELPVLPKEIPHAPCGYYKKSGDWINWGDWFGTLVVSSKKRTFWLFDKSRNWIIKNLPCKRMDILKWNDYTHCRMPELPLLPDFIPKHPHITYKSNGFISYKHWFGNEKQKIVNTEAKKTNKHQRIQKNGCKFWVEITSTNGSILKGKVETYDIPGFQFGKEISFSINDLIK